MILKYLPGTGLKGENEAEPQFLLKSISGLNLISFRSAFVVKACVVLIAIRKADGDVKPGGPLDDFR